MLYLIKKALHNFLHARLEKKTCTPSLYICFFRIQKLQFSWDKTHNSVNFDSKIRLDFTEVKVIFELEIFWSVAIGFGFRKCRCMTGSWEAAEMVFCLPLLLLMNSKWSPWAKRLHERRSNCYHPIFTSNEIEGNTSNYHSMECNSSWATFLKET